MDTPNYQSSSRDERAEGRPDDAGAELTQDLKRDAGDLAEHAKARARDAARSGQTVAAEQLHDLAEGMRRSAGSWDDDRHAWVKQGIGTAAESLDRLSSTLRERDVGELAGEVEAAARRHPLVFVGACALAGFMLVRFLKSTGQPGATGVGTRGVYRQTLDRGEDRGTMGGRGNGHSERPIYS